RRPDIRHPPGKQRQQDRVQPVQFGLGMRRRYPIFQASEDMQVETAPGIDWIAALERHGRYELSVAIREPYPSRHDADNPSRKAVNADGLPDHIRVLPEALLPVAVAQHHHKIAPG